MSAGTVQTRVAVPFGLFSLLALGSAALANTDVFDGTFTPSDWSVTSYTYGPNGGSTSVSQNPNGSPGPCREMTNTAGSNLSGALHANLYAPFTYDPSTDGAVESITFSIDSHYLNGISSLGFIVEQGGVRWRAGYFINTPGWANWSITPVYTDWIPLTAPPNTAPNLTAGGGPIKIGFWSANSSAEGAGTGYTHTGRYDNFSMHIEVDTCPADFNDDGAVDGADLGILLGSWGDSHGAAADLNGDGLVDGADLGTVLGAWGDCG